jgi:hypothetical protein
MTGAALLMECERRDIRITLAGDKLRVEAPPGAVTDALRQALAREKPAIIEVLHADAQARAAGLVVLEPGGVYHTAPDRLHEVLVMREDARWIAWAGLYPPPHFNGPKDRPRKTWMLYKGKDLRAALAAAVRFAERLLDRRDCGGAGGPDTRRYPPWAALVAGGAGVGAGGHSDPPGAGVSAAGAHCLRGQGCPKNS